MKGEWGKNNNDSLQHAFIHYRNYGMTLLVLNVVNKSNAVPAMMNVGMK